MYFRLDYTYNRSFFSTVYVHSRYTININKEETPPITEVRNVWSYTSTPPIYLNGMDRDSFIFD
jgi:hypothetical protein